MRHLTVQCGTLADKGVVRRIRLDLYGFLFRLFILTMAWQYSEERDTESVLIRQLYGNKTLDYTCLEEWDKGRREKLHACPYSVLPAPRYYHICLAIFPWPTCRGPSDRFSLLPNLDRAIQNNRFTVWYEIRTIPCSSKKHGMCRYLWLGS